MSQYIVYYLDRSLIVTDDSIILKNTDNSFKQPEDITKFLFDFESDHKNKHATFKTNQVEEAWNILVKEFQLIEAAGGIVKNPKNEILAIYRLGKWDLPKGKIEKGENPQEAAYREIEEECGISGHKILGKICDTYHTYKIGQKKVLKKTHWFAFAIDNLSILKPQFEENIEEVKWVNSQEFSMLLVNSYQSIQQVFNEAKAFNNFL